MEAVAVGGLNDEVIGVLNVLGVAEDGLVEVSYVAGENDLFFAAVLAEPDLDGGGAEQMPDVGKAHSDGFVELYAAAVFAGSQELEQSLDVIEVVQGLDGSLAPALSLPRFPFRIGDLNVAAVAEHYIQQGAGGGGGVNAAAESVFVQKREHAGVVDVRVGHKRKIQTGGLDRQLLIDEKILALLHAAVDDALFVADFYERAAARYLVGSAEKCDLHSGTSEVGSPAVEGVGLGGGGKLPVVSRAGELVVGQEIDLHQNSEADDADDGDGKLGAYKVREPDKKCPADEAQVKYEKLPFVADHEPLARADALKSAHFGVLQQQVDRHAVAVERNKGGEDKQQGPEGNEHCLKDVQPDDAEEHSEAVENVPVACTAAAQSVQHEDDKARAKHGRNE